MDPHDQEGRQYVVVHIHFEDQWQQSLENSRKPQNTTIVNCINLRHTSLSGKYPTPFKDVHIEEKKVFVISHGKKGWEWHTPEHAGKDKFDMSRNFQNLQGVVQWFPGDCQEHLPQELSRTLTMDEGFEEWPELLIDMLDGMDEMVGQASCVDNSVLDMFHETYSGIEVLAIGNKNYRLSGLGSNKGVLLNAIRDAEDVAKAFEELGASCKVVKDVELKSNLVDTIREWAEERLTLPNVRVAFFFWAGHAVTVNNVTYVIPAIPEKHVNKLNVEDDAASVHRIISTVRDETSACPLIVCLDACRTQVMLPKTSLLKGISQERGPDVGSYSQISIWYSTAHGKVASDGREGGNSPFVEGLMHCLRGDVTGKTFGNIFDSVSGYLAEKNLGQTAYRYGTAEPDSIQLLDQVRSVQMGLVTVSVRLMLAMS